MSSASGLRVVLIQPGVPVSGSFARLGRSHLPPLGLLYIAASLRRAGHRVAVFDMNLELPRRTVLARVAALRPQVVGLGSLAPARDETDVLARLLRRTVAADCLLVCGGPDATAHPSRYCSDGLFDAVLVGEAERTMVRLCAAWPEVLAGQPGIVARGDDPRGYPRATKIDPNATPLPARDLLPLRRYRGGPAFKKRRYSTSVFTHRGCPYRCTFCEKAVHDGPVRLRSAAGILDEVRHIRREHTIHDLRFIDDVFLVNPQILNEFLDGMLRDGSDICWMSTARVNLVDGPLLARMRRAGCYRLEFGVESGNERLLALTDKRINLDQAEQALRRCREAGIETIANFILGFPGETEDEMRRTVEVSLKLDPDYAMFFAFEPYSGAPMVQSLGPDQADLSPAVPQQQVQAMIRRAYSRFYFRPRTVARRLAARPHPRILRDLALMAAGLVTDK